MQQTARNGMATCVREKSSDVDGGVRLRRWRGVICTLKTNIYRLLLQDIKRHTSESAKYDQSVTKVQAIPLAPLTRKSNYAETSPKTHQ